MSKKETKKESFRVMFTREKANAGARLTLTYPDGSESPHWLLVLSSLSEKFRDKSMKINRKYADMEANKVEIDEVQRELEFAATTIIDWSFDEELTDDNIVEFLREAPQVREQVSLFSIDSGNFFKPPSKN